jgi:hypothetical protein
LTAFFFNSPGRKQSVNPALKKAVLKNLTVEHVLVFSERSIRRFPKSFGIPISKRNRLWGSETALINYLFAKQNKRFLLLFLEEEYLNTD